MNHTVERWVAYVIAQNERIRDMRWEDERQYSINVGPRPNGVCITLPNDLIVSIQWGSGNYCSRRYSCKPWLDRHDPKGCENAEIAISNGYGQWYRLQEFESGGDSVIGWQTVEDTERLIRRAVGSTSFAPIHCDQDPERAAREAERAETLESVWKGGDA